MDDWAQQPLSGKFLELLREHEIQVLAYIRRFPTSKAEQIKSEQMSKWLPENGVEYVWLGEQLGGYRQGGYKKHMRTKPFRGGIQWLSETAERKRMCIMCMEVNSRYCHRRFISAFLERKVVKVKHIIGKGQTSIA